MFKAHIQYNSGVFVSMELYSQLFSGPCHIKMLLLIFSHKFHILECKLLEKKESVLAMFIFPSTFHTVPGTL